LRLKERLDIEHQRYYIKLEIEVKPNPKCDWYEMFFSVKNVILINFFIVKVAGYNCQSIFHLQTWFTLAILSPISLLLANVIEWMTCKRLRIVYFWKATLYFCVRVHSFASVRNTKSPTKMCVCVWPQNWNLHAQINLYRKFQMFDHSEILGVLFIWRNISNTTTRTGLDFKQSDQSEDLKWHLWINHYLKSEVN
jgi:hypothetical protein